MDEPSAEDVVFIGGGPSMVFVLVHLLEAIRAKPRGEGDELVRITVVHPCDEFGTGTPFAAGTGTWPLLITAARHVLPGGAENPFVRWLSRQNDGWMDGVASASPRERAWMEAHRAEMQAGRFADLYLPRHLFGRYLREVLADAVDATRATARVRFLAGRATGVRRTGPRRFTVETGDGTHGIIHAKALVLATGSPPPAEAGAAADGPRYLHDVYLAGGREIERRLEAAFDATPPGDARLVIAGSSAAAMEMLYLVRTSPRLMERVERVTLVSAGGRLPDPRQARSGIPPACERLRALSADSAAPRADALVSALLADEAEARSLGATAEDLAGTVPRLVLEMLGRMDAEERGAFLAGAAGPLQRMLRRTGGPYLRTADELRARGTLEARTGTLSFRDDGEPVVMVSQDGAMVPLRSAFVINCTGSATLDDDPTPLTRSIRAAGDDIARINRTRRGFAVDERFEATPGVFVMGPLLAGYSHGDTHVWRLESADRISLLAPRLAEALAARVREARGTDTRHPIPDLR